MFLWPHTLVWAVGPQFTYGRAEGPQRTLVDYAEKDRELFLASEFHTELTPGWLGNVHVARYPFHVVSKIICMDPRIGLSLPACRK